MKNFIAAMLLAFLCHSSSGQLSIRCYNKGNEYASKGEYVKAIRQFDRAIRLDRFFAEAFYNRGLAKSRLKDYTGAIADYSKAIDRDPTLAVAFVNRGADKLELKDAEAAIADYTKAIALDPGYAKAYYNRGVAKFKLGKYEDALNDFDTAVLCCTKNKSIAQNNDVLRDATNNRTVVRFVQQTLRSKDDSLHRTQIAGGN